MESCPICGGMLEYFAYGKRCVNTPMSAIVESYMESSLFKRYVPVPRGSGECAYVNFDFKKSLIKNTDIRIGNIIIGYKPILEKSIIKCIEEQKNGLKMPLGEIIVRHRLLNERQIDLALKVQKKIKLFEYYKRNDYILGRS